MPLLTTVPLAQPIDTDTFPVTIAFQQELQPDAFVEWFRENSDLINQCIQKQGGILFRNIGIRETADFNFVSGHLIERPLEYMDGTTPRTNLGDNIYTSTEYDATQIIHLHNELSYSAKWPSRIFFCCIIPSPEGGATSIADSRKLLKEMDPELVQTIRSKGLTYIRNLTDGTGPGQSWQRAFQTEEKAVVEQYCNTNGIHFSWKNDGGLRIEHTHPGIIRHPQTDEEVWFNQMDQFHPLHLGEEVFEIMQAMYEDLKDLPVYVTFGDGTPVKHEWIGHVMATGQRIAINNRWEKGDLMMLDNVLVAHGRQPYSGDRKIVVAMH